MMDNTQVKSVVLALNSFSGLHDEYLLEQVAKRNGLELYSGMERMLGVYMGQSERSYKIDLSGEESQRIWQIETLLELAKVHNQESVLLIGEDGLSVLYFCESGSELTVGHWQEVSEEKAKASNCYSLSIETGLYYLAA